MALPMLLAASAPNAAESCAASSARQLVEGELTTAAARFEQRDGRTQVGLEALPGLAGSMSGHRQAVQPRIGVHQRCSMRSVGLPGDDSSTVSRFKATVCSSARRSSPGFAEGDGGWKGPDWKPASLKMR